MLFGIFRTSTISVLSLVAVLASPIGTMAQTEAAREVPAIDLAKVDLLKPLVTKVRNLAELSYSSGASLAEAYAFHEKQLRSAGFEPKAGATVTDAYASAVFQGKPDRIAVMIFPDGGKAVAVSLSNQGGVDLARLPVPDGCAQLFEGPSNIQYVTERPVEEMRKAIGSKLGSEGWVPYGEAGPIRVFKKGPMLIRSMVGSAPGQGGKTVLEYQSQRMSADIEAPAGATRIAYSETTKSLDVDTSIGIDEIAETYGKVLADRGWKATTEKPVEERFDRFWIFRNEDKELLELKLRKMGSGTRLLAKFMTAAEVEEESRKAEIAAKKQGRQSGLD